MNDSGEIVIWGASTRAASWSAARAGWNIHAWDLFADCDFPDGSSVHKLDDLACNSLQCRLALPLSAESKACFLPTGGWENAAGLPEWTADHFHLCGCNAEAIARSRDPFFWAEALGRAGLPRLAVRKARQDKNEQKNNQDIRGMKNEREQAPANRSVERWIRKSLHSIGGLGVRFVMDDSWPEAGFYDQQFQSGLSCSALCFTNADGTRVAGTSLQLTNNTGPEHPFLYAGNAWPLHQFAEVDSTVLSAQASLYAERLAEACGLTGLWGFDCIWQDSQLWVIEINPRYTAAMELFELCSGRSLLRDACWCGTNTVELPAVDSRPACVLKMILYAEHSFVLPADWDWKNWTQSLESEQHQNHAGQFDLWSIPAFSDLPHPGTAFHPGEPICTIWGAGESAAKCRKIVQQRRSQLCGELPAS